MRKKNIIPIILMALFMACLPNKINEITELIGIVVKLKEDQNKAFLKTLEPSETDCKLIFKEGASADKAIAYSKMKWATFDSIPENSMKPLSDSVELNILFVTKGDLEKNKLNGFPKEYALLANHLKDETTLYAMQYVNEDKTEQKLRAAFFKVQDHWVIIPKAYKAFQN